MGVLKKLGMFAMLLLVAGHARSEHYVISLSFIVMAMVYFHFACKQEFETGLVAQDMDG